MSKKLMIVGDSFCAYRTTEEHWPFLLGKLCNLDITGNSYPGQSFWQSKLFLDKYITWKDFNDTELFVFCHTELKFRPMFANDNYELGFKRDDHPNHEVFKTYIKYFFNPGFQHWVMKRYLEEIGERLKDKKVIHCICFPFKNDKDLYDSCNGIVLGTSLFDLTDFWAERQTWQDSPNHLSVDKNIFLAEQLHQIYLNYDNHLQKGQKNVWVSLPKISN